MNWNQKHDKVLGGLGMSTEKSEILVEKAARASILVALGLVILKGAAYWRSESVAVLGSMTDSGMDVFASLINYIAIRSSLVKTGAKSKADILRTEARRTLYLSWVGFAASAFLAWRAFGQIWDPITLEHGFFGVVVSVVAIMASMALLAYHKNILAKSMVGAGMISSLHFVGDVILNMTVILALLLATGAEVYAADGIFGVGIASYVTFSAWAIGSEAKKQLKKLDAEE